MCVMFGGWTKYYEHALFWIYFNCAKQMLQLPVNAVDITVNNVTLFLFFILS